MDMKFKHGLASILIAAVYFMAPETVNAQGKILYGFDMGFTINSFDKKNAPFPAPDLVQDFKKASRVSLEFGGTVEYAITQALTVSSGLRYVEKGGSYKTKNPNYIYTSQSSGDRDAYNYLRYRLVYVEVPVLIKLNVYKIFGIEAEESRVNLYGGISGMLNIGSKFRYNVFEGTSDVEESWESEKIDAAEKFVTGWIAGAEWKGGPFLLYARYAKSISEVYDTTQPGYETFDVSMSTISIGMGFVLSK